MACEFIISNNIRTEFCYYKNTNITPFRAGFPGPEAISKTQKLLTPQHFLSATWSIIPGSPTNKNLEPIAKSYGQISCFYDTQQANIRIMLLGGYSAYYSSLRKFGT